MVQDLPGEPPLLLHPKIFSSFSSWTSALHVVLACQVVHELTDACSVVDAVMAALLCPALRLREYTKFNSKYSEAITFRMSYLGGNFVLVLKLQKVNATQMFVASFMN